MPITLTVPVDVPAVRVLANRMLEDGTGLIEGQRPLQTAQCHRGGREIDRFHGFDRPLRGRPRPVFGRRGCVEIRPKRYRCPFCEDGPTPTQRGAGYDPNRPHPTAFEPAGWKRLIHRPVAEVSRQLVLGVKAVEGMLDHRLAPAVDWTAFAALETVGIDEVALLTGQGHAGAVVGVRDAAGSHVLAGLPDRLQTTGQAFLEPIPATLKATGRRVCIERGAGYAGAVAAALPAAPMVVDRFHVAVCYRDAVDELPKAACRRLNAGRWPARAAPPAALRPLRRREGRALARQPQGHVVALLEQTPTLASAYGRRTRLTAIFDHRPDRVTAQTRLQLWTEQVKAAERSCFDKCLTTLRRWRGGILNDLEDRHTSGFVAGLNNKLTRLKRRGGGLDDPVGLFRRLWLAIEGPRLWT